MRNMSNLVHSGLTIVPVQDCNYKSYLQRATGGELELAIELMEESPKGHKGRIATCKRELKRRGSSNELIKPVRCRDCKHYRPNFDDSTCKIKSNGRCSKCGGTRDETHFYAWGERKTENEVEIGGE